MTNREREIVRTLAGSVRAMTVEQSARTWWSATPWGRRRAALTLTRLEAEGWLHLQTVVARPIESFSTPLVSWRPGDPPPDFASVARALHRRAMAAATTVTAATASAAAVRLFSDGRALSVKLTQLTHDLNVAELYLLYRRRGLGDSRWTIDDRLPKEWPIRQRPDAVVTNEAGKIVAAVEYGGDYPPSRLRELHDGLASVDLPYFLW